MQPSTGAEKASTERSRQKLALAFIVRNEGRYAIQMLESIIDMVGFVACADTESDDDTVDVLRAFLTARGIDHVIQTTPFTGFQHIRNLAIDLVPPRFEWILMLDADEIILQRDFPKLLQMMDDDTHDAWAIPRFNWVDRVWGEKLPAYPDHQARLFRRRSDAPIRYAGHVHETLTGHANMGILPFDDVGATGFSEALHIHHLKLFQKSQLELHDREMLYQALTYGKAVASRRAEVVAQIWHGEDPFRDAVRNPAREDYQGWRSDHPYLTQAIEQLRPDLTVEVGVWKGASSIFMANLLRAHRIPGIVIAVDTWLGSYDHWLQPEWFASLRIENGYPSLFQTFTANVVGRDLQDFILPLPVDSANAAKIVEQRKLRPNLLHIDGSTDYNSVMADLTAWWPLLAEGGWLIGDDYSPNDPSWPGVTRAYHDFFKQTELENHDGKCRIRKL